MKRPKRQGHYEGKRDAMRGINLEAESSDYDDDIIELEDIIEMPDSPIDEDKDLDIEIFDRDSDFQPGDPAPKAAQPVMNEQVRELRSEDEDLINAFGDELEDETLFEPAESGEAASLAMGGVESQIYDEDDETVLGGFMDEPGIDAEEKVDLKARAAAAMKIVETAREVEPEPEAAISDGPPEPSSPAAPAADPAPQPPADLSRMADELISLIESRLQEHVRAMVESNLPGVVRSIINEEIEKLKKELQEEH